MTNASNGRSNLRSIILPAWIILLLPGTAAAGRPYQCSNHDPAHIATSIKEQEQLTNRYRCTGWRPVGISDFVNNFSLMINPLKKNEGVKLTVWTVYTVDQTTKKLKERPSVIVKQYFDPAGRLVRIRLLDLESVFDRNWRFEHATDSSASLTQFITSEGTLDVNVKRFDPVGAIVRIELRPRQEPPRTLATAIKQLPNKQFSQTFSAQLGVMFTRVSNSDGFVSSVAFGIPSTETPVVRQAFQYDNGLLQQTDLFVESELDSTVKYTYPDVDSRKNWTRRVAQTVREESKQVAYVSEMVARRVFYRQSD